MPSPIYAGIDFSLNSPAYCLYKNGNYSWLSITRSDRTQQSLLKSAIKPYSGLEQMPDMHLLFLDKMTFPDSYSEKERFKMQNYMQIVDTLWHHLVSQIEPEDDLVVAMEGLSFASNGNSLIDISMATSLLRERIITRTGFDNFHVYSPTAVKKYAYKGNCKKDELYHALLEKKETEPGLNNFLDTLRSGASTWISPSKAVQKPLDDLIDATWICLYLLASEKNY